MKSSRSCCCWAASLLYFAESDCVDLSLIHISCGVSAYLLAMTRLTVDSCTPMLSATVCMRSGRRWAGPWSKKARCISTIFVMTRSSVARRCSMLLKMCIRDRGNIILFIDEMHTLIGAGAAEGAVDAANILKPVLARGQLQAIGATTLDEYKKHIEKDAALERRFQPVMVTEPTEEDAVEILRGIRDKYEAFHCARITDEALEDVYKRQAYHKIKRIRLSEGQG